MKRFSLLLAFVLSILLSFGCCAGIQRVGSPPTDLVTHLKDSTVGLVIQMDDGTYATYCAGVWINKNHILTAKHCVDDNDDEKAEIGKVITFQTYKEFDGHFPYSKNKRAYLAHVAYDAPPNTDLAILKAIDDIPHGIATIGQTPPNGATVHHIGHPRGLQFSYMQGVVSEQRIVKAYGHNRHMLNIIGFMWHGSSGGGAFDSDGNLVGVASLLLYTAPGQSLFIQPKDIKKMLKKHKVKYHTN